MKLVILVFEELSGCHVIERCVHCVLFHWTDQGLYYFFADGFLQSGLWPSFIFIFFMIFSGRVLCTAVFSFLFSDQSSHQK